MLKFWKRRLRNKKDTAYFEKHSVLELTPEQITDSVTLADQKFSPKQIADAIQHQLEERLQFAKPSDPAVASLLFDYAVINAVDSSMDSAKSILGLAAEYGYPPAKIEIFRKDLNRRLAWHETKDYIRDTIFIAMGIGLLWYLYKRGIFVISNKDLKKTVAMQFHPNKSVCGLGVMGI